MSHEIETNSVSSVTPAIGVAEDADTDPNGESTKMGFEILIVLLCSISSIFYYLNSYGIRNFLRFAFDAIEKLLRLSGS